MCVRVTFPLFTVREGQIIVEWKIRGAYWHQCEQSVASDSTKGFSAAARDLPPPPPGLGVEETLQGK